jgi:hypothetical protein
MMGIPITKIGNSHMELNPCITPVRVKWMSLKKN